MKAVNGAALRASLSLGLSLLASGCFDEKASVVGQARARWLQTKSTCGTYYYTVKEDSFGGLRRQTSVEVTGDTPTARTFFTGTTFTGAMMITESWTEVGAEVGTHSAASGAALPRTMEQLYEDCERNVLAESPTMNALVFQADPQGVLRSCTYIRSGCADDCVVGDVVSDFDCGPLDLSPIRP